MNESNTCLLPMRPVLHMGEFAAAAGVSARTIRRAVKRGEVPAPRMVGRRFVWPRETVADFLGIKLGSPTNGAA